ncbi:hypothetical protein [Alteromonas gilva]|uniref:LRAT domain-containing protein n=1 Tax=Alteromonas gilva TaxID=2987522 RepID=A0ABT5L2I1_9ALTE|nr:hypothetical protein [Alteromonas gilva]MDC8831237.1 hypothetical protein [Alteromonas gilva]
MSVDVYPGESKRQVEPLEGAVVCCGIYGLFEHTGIWVADHIVELHGSGLVKAISPQRFLTDRSGASIYIACNAQLQPLVQEGASQRAIQRIFTYINYSALSRNCHRFTAECITGLPSDVCSFSDLNAALSRAFKTPVSWYPLRSPG